METIRNYYTRRNMFNKKAKLEIIKELLDRTEQFGKCKDTQTLKFLSSYMAEVIKPILETL